jgi:hypothetical protein
MFKQGDLVRLNKKGCEERESWGNDYPDVDDIMIYFEHDTKGFATLYIINRQEFIHFVYQDEIELI